MYFIGLMANYNCVIFFIVYCNHMPSAIPDSKAQGLTLIEVIVVLGIMAIIATIGVNTFKGGSIEGRDTKRKQDLDKIHIALELYFQKNKKYPGTPGDIYSSRAGDDWIIDTPGLIPAYLNSLPKDPINTGEFAYEYFWVDPDKNPCTGIYDVVTYVLRATLENSNDKEILLNKDIKDCEEKSLRDIHGWDPLLYVKTNPDGVIAVPL